ncbi:hypothetical protein NPA08_03340 [Mycoplasmopsis citelli]|uniref:TyrS-associated PheT N-terminal domain-related protein TapR n=1 Tax=Mycoplasmopsis citelli TaxID=171281 RepID=UPI002113D587|nr:hypothetical protein [Mycoplasmopsis citelli]UUD35965.1 hypothetical protein NPA08_03340 [Mycoplasmopsis citelli]
MILVHKLSNQFKNCTILSIDTRVKITQKITIENYLFLFDDQGNVGSINVFDDADILSASEKRFFSLNEHLSNKVKAKATQANLKINDSKKFVYVEILKREVHPKSEKLFVLTLSDGQKEFQVVTNTLDSTEGKVVLVALPGSITALGAEILEGKMLDVTSSGMLVGYSSLGFAQEGLVFGSLENIGKEFQI